ncbi:MAG TPA: bacteriohopanetetrol glucosamine biosynthesis glycosyltransferase HpnI [Bryobacteraceae bacterium]|nr:bacteriohopanetetrol glucosamine biosynthesis glycosyltransferase HpnI [Bryobacteraceae bacterium]
MPVLSVFLILMVAGALVYALLTIIAAAAYRRVSPPPLRDHIPISILKPLSGVDEGLEANLRSFFAQQYAEFEILFAVHDAADPAVALVEKLRREFPAVPTQLIVSGDPPYPNAKVYSLDRMLEAARHEIVVMGDSDVRVSPRLLETLAREYHDERVGLITCPYRAVAGRSVWSRMEAVFMNTEFLGGVLVARLLNGMDFALGPTIAVRKRALAQIGGFDFLKDYLAEDFVMGNRVAASGWRVLLSSEVIEHRIGSEKFAPNLSHRLRWLRSTRRSRPLGYIGQVFTNPFAVGLIVWAIEPAWWPALLATAMARAVSAWAQAGWVLHDPLTRRYWWAVLPQDIWNFLIWVAGFFGNTVVWRGRTYYLARDGRFEPKQ